MRKNTTAVYQAWRNGTRKTFHAISTDGQTIKSYWTPILRHGAGTLPVLNRIKYSNTTSRQQNVLRTLMQADGIKWTEQDGI